MTTIRPYKDEITDGGGDEGFCSSVFTFILTVLSVILVTITLPFSLCVCVRMVQEYERAVIFRLGRVKRRGAVGPGVFFILPCMDEVINPQFRIKNVSFPTT